MSEKKFQQAHPKGCICAECEDQRRDPGPSAPLPADGGEALADVVGRLSRYEPWMARRILRAARVFFEEDES